MKVTLTVPRSETLTFEMEIPAKYNKAFEYQNGINKPPTYFSFSRLSNEDSEDLLDQIERTCKAKTGKECDFLSQYTQNFEMTW